MQVSDLWRLPVYASSSGMRQIAPPPLWEDWRAAPGLPSPLFSSLSLPGRAVSPLLASRSAIIRPCRSFAFLSPAASIFRFFISCASQYLSSLSVPTACVTFLSSASASSRPSSRSFSTAFFRLARLSASETFGSSVTRTSASNTGSSPGIRCSMRSIFMTNLASSHFSSWPGCALPVPCSLSQASSATVLACWSISAAFSSVIIPPSTNKKGRHPATWTEATPRSPVVAASLLLLVLPASPSRDAFPHDDLLLAVLAREVDGLPGPRCHEHHRLGPPLPAAAPVVAHEQAPLLHHDLVGQHPALARLRLDRPVVRPPAAGRLLFRHVVLLVLPPGEAFPAVAHRRRFPRYLTSSVTTTGNAPPSCRPPTFCGRVTISYTPSCVK